MKSSSCHEQQTQKNPNFWRKSNPWFSAHRLDAQTTVLVGDWWRASMAAYARPWAPFPQGFCLYSTLATRRTFHYLIFHPQFNIWCLIYSYSFIHPSRIYYELAMWPAPSWLDSSVGRALHRHRRGHGFQSRSSLNFFRLSFRNCLSCVLTARIFFYLIFHPQFNIWYFIYSYSENNYLDFFSCHRVTNTKQD